MRRLYLLPVLLMLSPSIGGACGDKYLVRCVAHRSNVIPSSSPARILIFDDGSASMRVLADVGLAAELTSRGHRVYVVASRDQLLDLLQDTKVDLVIADWRRIDAVRSDMGSAPYYFPAVGQRDKEVLPALRREFASVFKVGESRFTTLSAIALAVGDALEHRHRL